MSKTRIEEAGRKAFEYHVAGFHCAEAVAKAIVELYGSGDSRHIPMAASGFGGGVGNTCTELCGALSGGVVAIGCLLGRSRPDENWGDAAETAAELRKGFVERWGTTSCAALLEKFGKDDEIECKRVSEHVSRMLAALLDRREANR